MSEKNDVLLDNNSKELLLTEEEVVKSNARRVEEFRRFFNLPEDALFDDFSCALQKASVPVQGRFYISDKHVCFGSIFAPKTKVISYQDIVNIRKRTTALVFDNAIEIYTSSETLFFTSFLFRDNAFKLLIRAYINSIGGDPDSIEFDDSVETLDLEMIKKQVKLTRRIPFTTRNLKKSEAPSRTKIPSTSVSDTHLVRTKSNDHSAVNFSDPIFSYSGNSVELPGVYSGDHSGTPLEYSVGDRYGIPGNNASSEDLEGAIQRLNDSEEEMMIISPENSLGVSSASKEGLLQQEEMDKNNNNILEENNHQPEINSEQNILNDEPIIPSPVIPLPPIYESSFNDSITRQRLVDREIIGTVAEFWRNCWYTKTSMVEEYVQKSEYGDFTPGDWNEVEGYMYRECSWYVPLRGINIGPSKALIEQKQKSRLKNQDTLEIEISSATRNVPFGDNFTWEERWTVSNNKGHIKVVIDALNHWITVPWTASVLKSTIDKESARAAKTNNEIFIDMAEQYIITLRKQPSTSATKRTGSAPRTQVSRRKNIKVLTRKDPKLPHETSPLHTSSSPEFQIYKPTESEERNLLNETSGISKNNSMEQPIRSTHNPESTQQRKSGSSGGGGGRAGGGIHQAQTGNNMLDSMIQRYNLSPNMINFGLFWLILVLLLFFGVFFLSLYSRISSLELQILSTENSPTIHQKLEFLEYFLNQLTKNITGDTTASLNSYFTIWKNTNYLLEQKISLLKNQIEEIEKSLTEEKEVPLSLFSQQSPKNSPN